MLERLICHPMFKIANSKVTHEVISLTDLGRVGERLVEQGVTVTCLGLGKNIKSLFSFFSLRRIIKTRKPDIVHTWMYHAELLGSLAARSAGIDKIIWCVRSTDIETGSKVTLQIRRLNSLLSKYIPSKIIYAAQKSRVVHEAIGYNDKIGEVIPNGYDLQHYKPSTLVREQVRNRLSINQNDTVLLSVGRFHPVKNHQILVEALTKLHEKYGNKIGSVVCLLVGRGLDAENEELAKMIEGTPAGLFRLLGERSDTQDLYASADIFCLHSLSEGFPNVLAEAMATALPCVTTDVGDAGYLLAEPKYVVDKIDVEALSQCLASLIFLSGQKRCEIGNVNRKRIRNLFSIEATVVSYKTIYKDVLERDS